MRRDEIREVYVAETGFTPADADTEITRAVATMRLSAEESVRIAGEEVPVAAAPGQRTAGSRSRSGCRSVWWRPSRRSTLR